MLSPHTRRRGATPATWTAAMRKAGNALRQAGAILAASLPLLASSQALTGHNVKYVKESGVHWIESSVSHWMGNTKAFQEVSRDATSVHLRETGGTTTVELDLAKREVRVKTADGTVNRRPIVDARTVSGLSANLVVIDFVQLVFSNGPTQPPTYSPPLGGVSLTEVFENGVSKGWKVEQASFSTTRGFTMPTLATSLPTTLVTRTWDAISFPESVAPGARRFTIDVTTGACTYPGYLCILRKALAVTGENVGQIHYQEANPHGTHLPPMLAKLVKTSHAGEWTMDTGTSTLKWMETGRTPDYVELALTGTAAKSRLFVNGTAQEWTGSSWQAMPNISVAYVAPVWKGQLGTVFAPVTPATSPGFQIQNKTDYPVLVTLEQVGCLYYGIVPPGQVFQRNTGAVWFTIKASIAPDLKEPTVESCIRKPAMYAATVAVAGISAIGSGGMATAFVVPAMLVVAAGTGSAIATQEYVLANGGTATDGVASRVGVTTLVRGGLFLGLALTGGGFTVAAGAALKDTALGSAAGLAWIGGTEVYTRYTDQADIDSLKNQLTQETAVTGAYAGYPWPWPSSDRVMPRYEITGGPRIKTLVDGSTLVLRQTLPLTITKVN